MSNAPLISVLIPSRRLPQLEGLLQSLKEMTTDLSRVHLIVKYDDDQPQFEQVLKHWRDKEGVSLDWICSPRLFGAFTMWVNTQMMWKRVPKDSYFVLVVTDEGRFLIKGWDDLIATYRHFYKDDIFRLRVSISRYVNYYTPNQTIYMPDCFPVYTRRWLELTEGFGDCWGSDAFQQSVAYHLGRGTGPFWFHYPWMGYYRDLVLHERILGGIDTFAQDIASDEASARRKLAVTEWRRMVSRPAQVGQCRLARRIALTLEADKLGITSHEILEVPQRKMFILFDRTEHKAVLRVSYDIPRWYTMYAAFQFVLMQIALMDNVVNFRKRFAKHKHTFLHAMRSSYRYSIYGTLALLRLFGLRRRMLPRYRRVGHAGGEHFSLFTDLSVMSQHRGPLYYRDGEDLVPSRFFLRQLKRAKYVTCDRETFNYWLRKAYGKDAGD